MVVGHSNMFRLVFKRFTLPDAVKLSIAREFTAGLSSKKMPNAACVAARLAVSPESGFQRFAPLFGFGKDFRWAARGRRGSLEEPNQSPEDKPGGARSSICAVM